MQHPFPAFNTPIASTAVDECAESTYVSPRGYAHPPSRRPRDTHLEDLYHPVLRFCCTAVSFSPDSTVC